MTSIPNFDNKEFPMRKGKAIVERASVCVIVYKKEADQILCLEWADNSWKTFVNGGTDGLPVQEAALMEIREETGYKNVTFVAEVGKTRATFFAAHKDENRISNATGLLYILDNEEQEEIDQKEIALHKPLWIDQDQVSNFVNVDSQLHLWEQAEKLISDMK